MELLRSFLLLHFTCLMFTSCNKEKKKENVSFFLFLRSRERQNLLPKYVTFHSSCVLQVVSKTGEDAYLCAGTIRFDFTDREPTEITAVRYRNILVLQYKSKPPRVLQISSSKRLSRILDSNSDRKVGSRMFSSTRKFSTTWRAYGIQGKQAPQHSQVQHG